MSLLNYLSSPALLRALGWAVVHSLWQGAGLALVLILLLHILRERAAVVRYWLAAIALGALVGLAIATFSYYYEVPLWRPGTVPVVTAAARAAAVAQCRAASAGPLPTASLPWPAAGRHYLAQCLPGLVGAWLLGLGVLAARLVLALGYVHRLRRQVLPTPLVWQQCLGRLMARAGLAQRVALRVSARVPSPLVVGYFKPVILLPLPVVNQLAPAELETVLAHELAHVMRRDYLFNFLQAVVETVFFYHPAVWYLSSVLHAERENCCDDLATQLTGNPQQLARALAALADLTQPEALVPRLALAGAGPAGSLLRRVQRLATYRPAQATGLWPASLVLLAVGLLLGGTLLAHPRPQDLTATRTRRATTRRHTPDDAPRTTQAPLATSDDELQALLQAQLLADGLLPDTEHYTFSLTAAGLVLNGQPQPAAYAASYQQLYEAATGYQWLATTAYYTENEVAYEVVPTALSAAKGRGLAPPRSGQ